MRIFLTLGFFLVSFFLTENICAESPYFYNCLTSQLTPTVQPTQMPLSPTAVPSATSVPTTTLTPIPTGNPTLTMTPTPTPVNNCLLKMGTGSSAKLDLVFMAEDFTNQNEFFTSVDRSINALRRSNLGAQRLDKFNIWVLLDLNQTFFTGFNCSSPGGIQAACWDHSKALAMAMSRCGGDTYVIINNDTRRTASVAGAAVWGGVYAYKFALDYPTIPHELGHSLVALWDEYSFNTTAPPGASAGINCAETGSGNQSTPCPKWAAAFPNTGCYQRCGYTDFYRPMQRSIMDRGGVNAVFDFNEPSLINGWDEMLKNFN